MRHIIIALLFVVLICVPSAQAASFSCADASSPVEQAICDDPTLSATDDSMALAFVHAVAGLTEEAGIVARQGQRDWYDYADTVCAADNLRGDGAVAVLQVACLQQLYDDRMGILGESRLINGNRFYTVDRYAAVPDDDAQFKLGLKVSSSLRIDGATPFALAFNAAAAAITKSYSGQFEDFAGTVMDDRGPHADNTSRMTVVSHNAARLSVRLHLTSHGHGDATDHSSFGMVHFLFDAARPMEASDMFEGEDWQAALADLVAERASVDLAGGDSAAMAGVVDDPTHWEFTKAGLMVVFQPGELTQDASAAVLVPWKALEGWMTEGATAIGFWDETSQPIQ